MIWLYVALVAYLVNAVAFILDKYLLHAPIPRPFAYSFWVALLSSAALVLIPFGVTIPTLKFFLIAMTSGASFFIGLIFLYRAIRISEISIVATKVGAITAVATFIFSSLLQGHIELIRPYSIALGLMVFGMLILNKFEIKIFGMTALSGLFSGLSFTLLKWLFSNADLVNGIFWSRMGFIGAALFSLFFVAARLDIVSSFKHATKSSKFLFLGNKIVAAGGFILLYFAIYMGNSALINGLAGLQYVFVFMMALLFRNKIPGIAENLNDRALTVKIIGLLCIVDGFIILSLSL
jgi:hypothetical protein